MGVQYLWNYGIDGDLDGEGGRQRTDGESGKQEKSEAGL